MRIHDTVIGISLDIKQLVSSLQALESLDPLDADGDIATIQEAMLDMVGLVSVGGNEYQLSMGENIWVRGAAYNGNPITAVLEYRLGDNSVEFRVSDAILLAFVDVIMNVYKDPTRALTLAHHLLDNSTLKAYARREPFTALKHAAHLMDPELRVSCLDTLDYDCFSHRAPEGSDNE